MSQQPTQLPPIPPDAPPWFREFLQQHYFLLVNYVRALTIQDEGVNMPQQRLINFVGPGVTVTDDPTNKRTIVTIP